MTGADAIALPALILALVALALGVHHGLVGLRRRRRVAYPEEPSRRPFRAAAWIALGTVVVVVVATTLPLTLMRWVPPLGTTFMAGRLPHCERVEYLWVPWERISPAVGISVVAAEDQRFPLHNGFDLEAIERALEEAERGRRLRGASTISQQVAKNLFLWPARSFVRKGLEAWVTSWIELLWPKRRVLEVYVNVAQFGPCTFGVEAASWRFFGKHAENLGSWEAALLAAVLPSPQRFRANAPSRYVAGRAAWIRRQVAQLGGPAYLGF